MRPLSLAGCAVVLVGLCGVAGASATSRSDQPARVPYTQLELVLEHGSLLPVAPGSDVGAHPSSAAAATAPAPVVPAPGAPAARGSGVLKALALLASHGELSPAAAAADTAAWTQALAARKHLRGTRRAELGSVLATISSIARSGGLSPSRLPALILTLARNEQWWTSAPMVSANQRVGFPGSSLVWEYYPGQGLQIQWLGTFGAADGFYDDHESANLAALVNQALSLAVARAGGIAWEYDFSFDGGSPPWVSAITEGTAVEALASAASMLHDSVYLTDAHDALGIFQAPPPLGIAAQAPQGSWYLIYSFAPHDHVINAFIQSLIGLFDLAYQGDALAQQLFTRGNDEARAALATYNTGYWSLYDQYGESDLSYHELLTGFLDTICAQTRKTTTQALWVLGEPPPAGATGPSGGSGASGGTATSGGTGTSGASGSSGASGASGSGGTPAGGTGPSGATGASSSTGSSGASGPTGATTNTNSVYCTTASAFQADLKQPPQLKVAPLGVLRAHHLAKLHFTLSKISNVSLSAAYAGATSEYGTLLIGHGAHVFTWRPRRAGSWTLTLTAVDLAGNRAVQTLPVSVLAAQAH